MTITSEDLRTIADMLVPFDHYGSGDHFICNAAYELGQDVRNDVRALLQKGGLSDMGGCLGYDADGLEMSGYRENAMQVRFMYLEFLALYLEDQYDWETFMRRTEDPKLRYTEKLLTERGIPHRRNGHSFHAPILEVPKGHLDAAWALLDEDVFGDEWSFDDIPDDDAVFEDRA